MKCSIMAVAALILVVGAAGRAEADLIVTAPSNVIVGEGTNFSLVFNVMNNGPDQLVNQAIVGRQESGVLLSNSAGLEVGFAPPVPLFPATIDAGATVTFVVSLKSSILPPSETISTGNLLTVDFFYDDPNMTDREVSAEGSVLITVFHSASVPEPGSLALMGIGALGLLGYARRRAAIR